MRDWLSVKSKEHGLQRAVGASDVGVWRVASKLLDDLVGQGDEAPNYGAQDVSGYAGEARTPAKERYGASSLDPPSTPHIPSIEPRPAS